MGARVAVAGASGYAGGELLRLLAGHPDLEIGPVTADSSAGQPVGAVHAHLAGVPALAGRVFEPHRAVPAGRLRPGVRWRCPPGSRPRWPPSIPAAAKVVDLGPDFRLADPEAWARHYGGEHAGRWVTGLPELPGPARADQRGRPGGGAGLLRHGRDPGPGPAGGGGPGPAAGRRGRRRLGTSGAGRSLRAEPAGQRGHGLGVGLPGRAARTGTRPRSSRPWPRPARPGRARPGQQPGRDQPGRDGPVTVSFTPGPGADAARHPGHLHRPAGRSGAPAPRSCGRRWPPPTTASRS